MPEGVEHALVEISSAAQDRTTAIEAVMPEGVEHFRIHPLTTKVWKRSRP